MSDHFNPYGDEAYPTPPHDLDRPYAQQEPCRRPDMNITKKATDTIILDAQKRVTVEVTHGHEKAIQLTVVKGQNVIELEMTPAEWLAIVTSVNECCKAADVVPPKTKRGLDGTNRE